MTPILLTFVPFALIFVYLVPTPRSKVASIFYLLTTLFLIWGVGGFVFSGNPTPNELYVFYAFYIFVLGIHVPLLLKLSQINHKKDSLKSARKILGDDIKHLNEQELHYRIKH